MRILYLVDSYRPARSACANRAVVLVEALRAAGHDVQVLASSDSALDAPAGYEKPEHITFFRTFPLRQKSLVNRLRNNFGGQRESIKTARRMGSFDMIICTTPPLLLVSAAIKIAEEKGAKLVWDVRDVWPDVAYEMGSFSPKSLYGRFFAMIAQQGYRSADLVCTVSPGKAAKLSRRFSRGEVVLVPNGVDQGFTALEPDPNMTERFGLGGSSPVCVYVGNIGLAQGLGTLLDIAAKRPEARFLLFGNGADRVSLEERAQAEGIGNVRFCGLVDASGVRSILATADVAYVPLVNSQLRDSIPTKLYEALSCGCPVLLAAEGDAADLLDECGLGGHAAPEDADALLSEFDRLFGKPFSTEERSRAAKWVLANHSRQMFAHRFVEAIEKLEGGDDAR